MVFYILIEQARPHRCSTAPCSLKKNLGILKMKGVCWDCKSTTAPNFKGLFPKRSRKTVVHFLTFEELNPLQTRIKLLLSNMLTKEREEKTPLWQSRVAIYNCSNVTIVWTISVFWRRPVVFFSHHAVIFPLSLRLLIFDKLRALI